MRVNFDTLQEFSTEMFPNNSLENIEINLNKLNSDIEMINKFTNCDNLSISEESFITNILVKMADILTGLVTNIYASLKFLKNVKRSELEAYVNKNNLETKLIFKLPYTKIANVLVQTPPFRKSYESAITFIDETYDTFDIERTNPIIINYIKEIVTLIINEHYQDVDQSIMNLTKSMNLDIGNKTIEMVRDHFSNIQINTIEFGKLFNSTKTFENTFTSLSNHFDKFCYPSDILKSIKQFEKSISKVLDLPNSDKKELLNAFQSLDKIVFKIAQFYDGFGNLVKMHLQTEHNFIKILGVLGVVAKKV